MDFNPKLFFPALTKKVVAFIGILDFANSTASDFPLYNENNY